MFINQENFNIEQQEIWLPVVEYEGLYEVSSYGRVKSLERKVKHPRCGIQFVPERVLKAAKDRHDYLFVRLYKNGIGKCHKVHRLVMKSFKPDLFADQYQVNHRDERVWNNNISNLEWVSAKENCNYGTRNSRNSKARTNHPSMSKSIQQFTRTGIFVAEYPSLKEAGRVTGLNFSNIAHCAHGRIKSCGGYRWAYKEAG